ncbi:hypothetical protein FNV43_RR09487 [Rhamnella rubrinervis]|uniref:Sulfotransferase n=1 Tax=Rhamnella rubrinervis TaxID=2594499 RepID=A0A8K0MJU1_9ROSA|nr:hypothetical protein FNV43_RR09487 [Rhamnella rubrinervis]
MTDHLPKENCYFPLRKYDDTWYSSHLIPGVVASKQLFKAEEGDIILASLPKSGTTWLKALIFSIVNRNRFKPQDSPLLTTQPHDLVLGLEFDHFRDGVPQNLNQPSRPGIFATHVSHASLSDSIKASNNCRIVYVCRNPLDNFMSYWHFFSSSKSQNVQGETIEESFVKYCKGVHPYCPFWSHNLEYWKASLEKPEKVLFLMYEDLKEDIVSQLKRLALFLGFPFTEEEQAQGLVEEISMLCSLGNLKSLEVNQNGVRDHGMPVSSYFRNGEVGDYVNHLTPSMIETLN